MKTELKAHCGRAYGLDIESSLPLPELLPGDQKNSDVRVLRGRVNPSGVPAEVDVDRFFWADGGHACHIVRGVGSFLVRDGSEVVVDAEAGAPEELLRLSILGPALALALQQRGHFVLHASSVSMDGQAVAFMGAHASGKSTLAAGLHRLGHSFVSDDVTAVILDGSHPRVVPSFPQLKLWPDGLRQLGVSPEGLPRVHPQYRKRALRLGRGFAASPQRLERLYALSVGPRIGVETLPPTEGFAEILRQWYGGRFGTELFKVIDVGTLFRHAGQLAREVAVKRLVRPASLMQDSASFRRIERTILEDLGETSGAHARVDEHRGSSRDAR